MRRNYQHLSTEALNEEKDNLLRYISEQEEELLKTQSKLLCLLLSYYIKTAKEKIHMIDAELCYRKHHNQ